MSECCIKPFDTPDEKRVFTKGIFELIKVNGMILGRTTYEPGWVWSKHVGPEIGKSSCNVAHVGVVISGHVAGKMDNGREPYVSLHLMGAEEYAT